MAKFCAIDFTPSMTRYSNCDLFAFMANARERSSTRAVAKLGMSQSSLNNTIRSLGARLGVRLRPRATPNVAPTDPPRPASA